MRISEEKAEEIGRKLALEYGLDFDAVYPWAPEGEEELFLLYGTDKNGEQLISGDCDRITGKWMPAIRASDGMLVSFRFTPPT